MPWCEEVPLADEEILAEEEVHQKRYEEADEQDKEEDAEEEVLQAARTKKIQRSLLEVCERTLGGAENTSTRT